MSKILFEKSLPLDLRSWWIFTAQKDAGFCDVNLWNWKYRMVWKIRALISWMALGALFVFPSCCNFSLYFFISSGGKDAIATPALWYPLDKEILRWWGWSERGGSRPGKRDEKWEEERRRRRRIHARLEGRKPIRIYLSNARDGSLLSFVRG